MFQRDVLHALLAASKPNAFNAYRLFLLEE